VVDQVTALEHAAPDQPVDAHWLPSQRLTVETLRRPVESAQYTSLVFGRRLREAGLVASMGTVGDALDNAVAESFFATLECELLDRQAWPTRAGLRTAVFDFIEVFYNRQRRHSTIGYQPPVSYEHQHPSPAPAA
jgi:putative transposase